MTLRSRDRIALVAILFLALVGGYYMLALKPERQQIKALDAATATQQQTLASEQQQYVAGRAAQAALRANAAQWTSVRVAVPVQSDIPALLRTLERTANAAHVKMRAIQLTGSSASTAASSAVASSTGGATGVPIQLSFAGGYVALDSLVRRLDGLVVVSGDKVHATGPLLSITSVQLSGAPKLVVQLTANIYQLPASSAAGQVATTGGQ
jgi:Tfp pilus assembly protein PilO